MVEPLLPLLQRVVVALLIGLLIGLDRERAEVRKDRSLFAGVRTFPLIALAGAVPMLLVGRLGPALVVASFVAVAAVALVSYARSAAEGREGATTEMAAIATFLLGTLAGAGEMLVAGAAGIVVAVLLVAKFPLEAFSRALTSEELTAVLELAVISVIVLPLVPDRGYGPWEALNPREIWLVVVLVSGLSFLGFIAGRLLGERGLIVAGAIGGLVSSTAVTYALAERSSSGATRAAAAGAVLASTVMALRIIVLAGAVNPDILSNLAVPMLVMAGIGALASWLIARGQLRPQPKKTTAMQNPFSLRAALVFGVIYATVSLGVRAARELLGDGGVYAASVVSGLADVDALTIALTRLGPGTAGWRTVVLAITTAAIANNLVKVGLAVFRGTGAFRSLVALSLGAMSGGALLVSLLVAGRV